MIRLLRIAGIAGGLMLLFHLSQQAGAARGNEEVPGKLWALGIVGALLLVRAVVLEGWQRSAAAMEKDLLWGLSAGALLTVLLQR